jgi:hypothetical protein
MQGDPLFGRYDERRPFVSSIVNIVTGVAWTAFGTWQAGKNWLFSDWLIGGEDGLTANEVGFGFVALIGVLWIAINVFRLLDFAVLALRSRDKTGSEGRSAVEQKRVRELGEQLASATPFEEAVVDYDQVRLSGENGPRATVVVTDRAVYLHPSGGRLQRFPFESIDAIAGGGVAYPRWRFIRPIGARQFEKVSLWLEKRADGEIYEYVRSRIEALQMATEHLDAPGGAAVTCSYRFGAEDGSGVWNVVLGDSTSSDNAELWEWVREVALPSLNAEVPSIRAKWIEKAEHIAIRSRGRIHGYLESELEPPDWGAGEVAASERALGFITDGQVRHACQWRDVTSYSASDDGVTLYFHPKFAIEVKPAAGRDVWLALVRKHGIVEGNPFDGLTSKT